MNITQNGVTLRAERLRDVLLITAFFQTYRKTVAPGHYSIRYRKNGKQRQLSLVGSGCYGFTWRVK